MLFLSAGLSCAFIDSLSAPKDSIRVPRTIGSWPHADAARRFCFRHEVFQAPGKPGIDGTMSSRALAGIAANKVFLLRATCRPA
ncbi:hypothetical protein EDS67_20550 [candidate division KSB1 bacterium]|nr:MAG: hypothetical protein EDS67_20550 [candidate division KSB1 bacterium]MCE7943772.1 hypothetical protein [Chlorobi bacterium CHB1]